MCEEKREAGEIPGLGGDFSVADAINDAGFVVGMSETAGGEDRAVLWTPDGRAVDLSALAGVPFEEAVDVNEAGVVVGNPGGVVWSHADSTVLRLASGNDEVDLEAINDDGWVVGERGDHAALWILRRSDPLSLTCEPSTVRRGEPVTCTVEGGSGATVESWTFTGGGHTVTRQQNVTSREWSGTMVVSGTIAVTVDSDGNRGTARADVNVRARDWEDPKPVIPEPTVCQGLSADCPLRFPPQALRDFGQSQLLPRDLTSAVNERVLLVADDRGPNRELWHLVNNPVPPIPFERYQIYINSILDRPEHPFWRQRTDCSADEIDQIRRLVLTHEREHARNFIANLKLNPVNQIFEGIRTESQNTAREALRDSLFRAAEIIDSNSQSGPLPNLPCSVTFGGSQ